MALLDDFSDALEAASKNFDSTTEKLKLENKFAAASQTDGAANKLHFAAEQVNAISLEKLLADNVAAQKLADITKAMDAKTAAIASDEANVSRIVGIASAVTHLLDSAFPVFNPDSVLSALTGLSNMLNVQT
jgi:hypothetical protein